MRKRVADVEGHLGVAAPPQPKARSGWMMLMGGELLLLGGLMLLGMVEMIFEAPKHEATGMWLCLHCGNRFEASV